MNTPATFAAILAACAVAGCASTPVKPAAPAVSQSSAQTPAPIALRDETPAQRFQSAVNFLQNGETPEAEAELKAYLAAVPNSKSANYLLTAIETPIGQLYPSGSFEVRLARNESLASLAKTYLGNSLGFYGLARYNNIPVPSKVFEGQVIQIPKTAYALAARNAAPSLRPDAETTQADIAPAAAAISPAPAASPSAVTAVTKDSAAHKKAERFYRDGLVAFQHQDLDSAITAWKAALALDPAYTEAQLNLAQAEELKENLAKLRK